jgi:hypothetical protein
MSCPHVAGAAALVRQYFVQGFYPSGEKTPSDSLIPSAALLKAMLISSATDLQGKWNDVSSGKDNWKKIPASPSFQQGYGRMQLDQVLYFDGWDLNLFVDDSSALTTGQSKEYKFKVSSDHNVFTVVLVWTDPPALVSSTRPLVNNLNLEAISPDGTTWYGNDAVRFLSFFFNRSRTTAFIYLKKRFFFREFIVKD